MSLIVEFKKGTPATFGHFYNQFYTPLYYFARKIMDDPVVAENVIADSFLKLWQKHEQFDSEDHIKNFLYLTTKNACLNLRAHEQLSVKTVKNQKARAIHLLRKKLLGPQLATLLLLCSRLLDISYEK